MTNLCFRFIVAESLLRSLQNIPQTHASEVIHVAPADEDFSFTWRCTFSPGFPIPEWGEKQLFLSPNSHHTSNSSSCVQSTYWTNHCFLSETQTCTKDFRANVGSTVWTGSGGSSLRDLWTRRNNQGRFCWSSLLFPVVQPTWENSVTWPSSLFVYDNLFQLFPVNSTFIICRNNSFCEEDARQVLARLETKLTG